ncbi:hypothetical protein J4450_06570 [Candidatus Micrarchaeota archaeon]|nr:hypothetical protein [Candidatus Micrarchaeota archaeon]
MKKKKLEDTTPISIVFLNNILNIIEDISNSLFEITEIQTKRPFEYSEFIQALKSKNQSNILKMLPDEIAKQVMSSFFGIIAEFAYVKQKSANPEQLTSEELNKIANALKKEIKNIRKLIKNYKKNIKTNKKDKKIVKVNWD